MPASLNQMNLIGNLGSDPEMKFLPSGKPVTTFRVACNSRYTNRDGEKKETTEWFTVACFGKMGELCNQYLTKGSLVYVSGELKSHSWEGQDGQKRFRMEVRASTVKFLSPSNGSRPTAGEGQEETQAEDGGFAPDELPF